MKNALKYTLFITACMLSAALLLFGPFLYLIISTRLEEHQIRNEIFEYVEENKDSIELISTEYAQYFVYTERGFWDAGVIYGYFYVPAGECPDYDTEYRGGYRSEGSPSYGNGWVYFEEICDNWYYYEDHYG